MQGQSNGGPMSRHDPAARAFAKNAASKEPKVPFFNKKALRKKAQAANPGRKMLWFGGTLFFTDTDPYTRVPGVPQEEGGVGLEGAQPVRGTRPQPTHSRQEEYQPPPITWLGYTGDSGW